MAVGNQRQSEAIRCTHVVARVGREHIAAAGAEQGSEQLP